MAVSDGETITVVKDMGLVTTVFDERTLSGLHGHLAIGHTRYSTHGSSDWNNAQPAYRPVGRAGFALGHNGNLTETDALIERAGMLPGHDRLGQRRGGGPARRGLPRERRRPRARRARRGSSSTSCPTLVGAFSFVLMDATAPLRGPRPERLPAAVPRPARPGRGPRGLGAGVGVAGARRHRGHLRAGADPGELVTIGPDGVRFAPAVRLRRSPTGCASSSSCTSHARTPACTASRCTAPAGGWGSCWPGRPRSTPTW